jgi:hypothetical protein
LRTLAGAVTTIKFFSAQVWLERNRLWHCQVLIHLNLMCKLVLPCSSRKALCSLSHTRKEAKKKQRATVTQSTTLAFSAVGGKYAAQKPTNTEAMPLIRPIPSFANVMKYSWMWARNSRIDM